MCPNHQGDMMYMDWSADIRTHAPILYGEYKNMKTREIEELVKQRIQYKLEELAYR